MEEQGLELLNEDYLMSKIYIIRGVQVMLDADLAAVYGYETRSFNQQVKNNIEKFDADFRFQLTKEEFQELLRSKKLTSNNLATNYKLTEYESIEVLTSQNVILKKGRGQHSKFMPYAFTRNGIAMLSSVLRSQIAVEVNISIMRAFTATAKKGIVLFDNYVDDTVLTMLDKRKEPIMFTWLSLWIIAL